MERNREYVATKTKVPPPVKTGTVVVSASAYECGDSTAAVGKASPHPMMPIRPREDLVFPGLPGAFSPAGHEVTPSSSGIGSEFALPMSSNTVAGPVDVTPEVNGISDATASKPNPSPNTRRAIVACATSDTKGVSGTSASLKIRPGTHSGISALDETDANNKTLRCASARPARSRWSPQFLPAAMSRLRVALRCTLPTRLCRKGRGVLDLHKQRRTNNQPAAMSSAASPGSDDDHVPSLSGTVVVSASAYECGDSTAAVGKASPHPMMPIRPREDLVFPGLPGAFSPAGHEVTPSSSGIGSEFALPMSSNTVAGPVDVTPEVNGIPVASASIVSESVKPNPNTRRVIVAYATLDIKGVSGTSASLKIRPGTHSGISALDDRYKPFPRHQLFPNPSKRVVVA